MARRRSGTKRYPARRGYPSRRPLHGYPARRSRSRTRARRRVLGVAAGLSAGAAGLDWVVHQALAHGAAAESVLVAVLLLGVVVAVGCWLRRAARARAARERVLRLLEEDAQREMVRQRRLRDLSAYQAMNAKEFEEALAALCVRDGCTQVRVVGGSGDLGADVIAQTRHGRIVVQAKRYGPKTKVGSRDVQIVNGTYREHGAHKAVIVTTSRFTKAAQEFAARVGIVLVDRDGLAAWAGQIGPPPWQPPGQAPLPAPRV